MFVKYLKHTIYFLILAILAVTYSCGPLDVASLIAGRIDSFETALNMSDRTNIKQQFHPDTENYQQIADDTVFDIGPLSFANEPFAFSMGTFTENADGTWSATGTLAHSGASGLATTMTMKKSGMDYLISVLIISNGIDEYEIRQFRY